MKNKKHNIKINKTSVEFNLLYDKKLSIQSFSLLCNMFLINIRLIKNNIYYTFLNNEIDEYKNIIYENKLYGIDLDNKPINLDNKLYIINSIKPINSITYYKMDDLINMATKLNITIKNSNNKNKLKSQLYDEIYNLILN